ncbi:MAG: hypothetical protein IPM29_12055 [Planctomycetes bacterium]|nr:hypothetical protein [Planctomycetota bacterium]
MSVFREILNLLRRDDLMSQALRDCCEMLDLCQPMVRRAVDSLRNADTAYAHDDIHKLDKKLNAFERDVRRKVVTHLALGNTADTSSGLALVSIVVDIERIGDYSKNIVDLAAAHPLRLQVGEHEAEFGPIEQAALELFDRASAAFKAGDANVAREIMRSHKTDVSKRWRAIEERLVAGNTTLGVADGVTLALYGRFLKRISAHSRNLVSSIVNPVERIGYSE